MIIDTYFILSNLDFKKYLSLFYVYRDNQLEKLKLYIAINKRNTKN